MIYYNSKQASGKIYNLSRANKIMYGKTQIYPDYIKPDASFKWKATYTTGVTSAECDSTSAITYNEINKTNLVSVEIGDDCVTSIGNSAFFNYTSLTSCTIGSGVTSISDYAFYGCTGLTSIDIPSGVTNIGTFAFYRCSGLTSATIGSGVTSIGNYAFTYCTSLTGVTIHATTPPTLGSDVFYSTNNCPIYVPAASVETYKSASGWSSYASRIQAIQ